MKPMRRVVLPGFIVAIALLLDGEAEAATIRVGPLERVQTIAEAARLAQDDDIVEISAGNYHGDVAVWTQKRLTIRGANIRPVLHADGNSAEGKAIWVIRGGDITISKIEFRGARVSASNGAGIRFEKGRLTVLDCAFIDNQIGILTANFPDAELTIERSLFEDAPMLEPALPHLLYVGHIALLRVTGSRFHGGRHGHLLKSRARISDVRYNLLIDGPGGSASYEADFPNGGDVTLVGNVIAQSDASENRTLVAFGAEGNTWPLSRIRMVHNTLHSEGLLPARFLNVFFGKFAIRPEILTRNNLLVGPGSVADFALGGGAGNYQKAHSAVHNSSAMDFTLTDRSMSVDAVGSKDGAMEGLQPRLEHVEPGRLSPLSGHMRWVPGAIQAAPTNER
jgi:hypothetical protein